MCVHPRRGGFESRYTGCRSAAGRNASTRRGTILPPFVHGLRGERPAKMNRSLTRRSMPLSDQAPGICGRAFCYE